MKYEDPACAYCPDNVRACRVGESAERGPGYCPTKVDPDGINDAAAKYDDAADLRIVVFGGRVVDAVRIHLCGAIPGTTFSRFTHATGAHIVRTICACRIFIFHAVSPASGLNRRDRGSPS